MPVIAMPDGLKVRFPDEMPPDEIKALIVTKYPNAAREAADRLGTKPYKSGVEGFAAAGAAGVQNVPGRIGMGVQGLVQGGQEAIAQTLDRLATNPAVYDDWDQRPWTFDTFARAAPGLKTKAEIDAKAEDYWTRYRDPAKRDEVLREIGMTAAKGAAGAQLKRQALAGDQVDPDVKPGSLEDYFGQVIGATAEAAPGIAAAVLTRNPAPALMAIGMQSAGMSYGSGRDKGLDPTDARVYAGLQAAAEIIPELLPLSVFLREGGGLLMKVGGGAVTEAASEAFTAGIQALIDKGFLEPGMTWGEAWPRIRDGAIVGAGAGGLMGGVAAGAGTVRDAAGAGINAARQVSEEVFGDLSQGLGRQAQTAALATEMARELAGKTLQERVNAMAERRRQMLETPTGEAPAVDTSLPTAPAPAAVDRIIGIESGGDPTAQNPRSSAGGLGQFLDATWLETVRKHAPEMAGQSDADLLALKTDASEEGVSFQRQMLEAFTADNAAGLADAGIEATDGNLYLAHFLGLGGAKKALAADPGATVRSVMGDAVVKANPFLAGMTVDDMVAWAAGKMGASKGAAWDGKPRATGRAGPQGTQASQPEMAPETGQPESVPASPLTAPEVFSIRNAIAAADDNETMRVEIIRDKDGTIGALLTEAGLVALPSGDKRRTMSPEDAIMETFGDRTYSEVTASGAASPTNPNPARPKIEGGSSLERTASWVIRNKETGEVIMETFDREKVDRLDTEKYEAVPIGEYLGGINGQKPKSPKPVTAITPSGKRVHVQPEIVDIATLTKASGDLQPRDRSRAASDAQIEDIAINLDPARLIDFATKPGEVIDGAKRKSERQVERQGEIFGAARADGKGTAARGARAGKPGVQKAGARAAQPDPALTRDAAFKRWFGKSKVIDSDGKPLVVYHGTGKDFAQFDIGKSGSNIDSGFLGAGAYFTDTPRIADYYANAGVNAAYSPNVLPVFLALKNPFMWGKKTQGVRGLVFRGERLPDAVHDEVVRRAGYQYDPKKELSDTRFDEQLLSSVLRDVLMEQGHDGVIATFDNGGAEYVAFKPTQIKSAIGNRGTFDPDDDSILASRAPTTQKARAELEAKVSDTFNLTFNPGPGYVPMLQAGGALPPRQTSVLTSTGQMPISQKVTKRDEPRKKLLDVIGARLYQQKVKGKSRLGFYRQQNSEVRIKHYDDVEVMAHEAAHFLDFHAVMRSRFTALRQRFASELDPLSYTPDPQLVNIEGFAEYVRLWSTQYATAKRVAPNFTAAFEAALRKARLWRKMTAFQKAAHGWYYQGDLARFRGKSGESEHFVDTFKAWARSRPRERFLQGALDPAFGAKVIERETTGTIASAERSAWKLWRLTRGAESMHEAAIRDGALVLNADGSYGTTGKGLMEIFYPATKHGAERLDMLMEYFKARRAQELKDQKRENLFSDAEIRAGLALAQQHPEFETIFAEWIDFNDTMLQFYSAMNLITSDQLNAIRKGNKAYVPFMRVLHQVEGEADVRGDNQSTVTKRLKGGEQNTREIAENIMNGLHAGIQAALTARAKSQLFTNIKQSQAGSEFAAEIPPDSKRIKVAEAQMVERIADALVALGVDVVMPGGMVRGNAGTPNPVDVSDIESVIAAYPEMSVFWQHNMLPTTTETTVESVIIGDKLRHFEVNSPLLVDLLTAPRAAPFLIRMARIPKRFLTTAITSMPQFQIPNAVRDTFSMAAQSKSGSRAGYETLRGFKSSLADDANFKAFRANGGLFSGRVSALNEANRNAARLNLPSRNSFDTMGKALAGWRGVVDAVEQGSRVGEFSRAVDKGENPLEAAFRGRMISGDFAQMGRNEVWSWVLQITPFANAGLRGIETMVENLFTDKGRITPKSISVFTFMALTKFGLHLTIATALLWWLNQDDERYKALTVDEKARFWHIWTPDGQHWQVPKPYGVGFIFADIPEIALEFVKNRDGEDAAKALAFGLAQHFWFMDYPGFIQPGIEALANRKFTGAPIVPANLAGLTGEDVIYQRTDATPEVYRQLGKALKISPLMAEHYLKGFTGYAEAFMVDATEFLLWNDEKWGPRPFARNVLSYFTHQFDGREQPFRTKWTEGYYELRARAQSKAAAYGLLFKEAPRDLSDFTTFTKSEVNLTLRQLGGLFGKVDRSFQNGPAYLESIKYDPKLSREEKEKRINEYYGRRNQALGDTYRKIDELVTKLEQGMK